MKKVPFIIAIIALCMISSNAQELPLEDEYTEEVKTVAAVPSRSITLQKNQYLDIVYPGTGWIYLGEIDATALLKYSGRKIEEDFTSFTLRGREEGSAILHFFKNDALTGEYIEDYLEVTVKGSSRISDHIKAPMYADIVPPRPSFTKSEILSEAIALNKETEPEEEKEETVHNASEEKEISYKPTEQAPANKGSTVIQNTSSTEQTAAHIEKQSSENKPSTSLQTDNLNASEILSLAQKSFDAKEYEQCMKYLEAFFEKTESNLDEGMYLQGRTLESPSPIRDIKKSLSIYKAIVRQYPESSLWDKANERITYIERFYFDIR